MKKFNFIISLLCIILLSGCNNEQPTIPTEESKLSTIFKDEVVDEFIIRNHNVAFYDNIYHVYLDIYNENNIDITYSTLIIQYYHDTALIYSTEESLSTIASNSNTNISFDIDINLVNANRVEYQLKK